MEIVFRQRSVEQAAAALSGMPTYEESIMHSIRHSIVFPILGIFLVLSAAGCDGILPIGNDNTNNSNTNAPASGDRLFVANFGAGASGVGRITSYSATADGNKTPETMIEGFSTQLNGSTDLAILNSGQLLVSNYHGYSFTMYNNPRTADGDIAPARVVSGGNTSFSVGAGAIAYRASTDQLFLGGTGVVLRFDNVSDAAFSGNIPPSRRLYTTADGGTVLDPQGNIYEVDRNNNTILIVDNASGTDEDILSPTRSISTDPPFASIRSLFIDANDRLYVVNTTQIIMFVGASSLSGVVGIGASLTFEGAENLGSIVVDGSGTGYVLDQTEGAIIRINGIAGKSGTITPDAIITGDQTGLWGPTGLFLLKQ